MWQLGERRSLFVVQDSARAGHALHTIFADDRDALVAEIAARGIEPAETHVYSSGVRRVAYRDADGNEVGFGGAPA